MDKAPSVPNPLEISDFLGAPLGRELSPQVIEGEREKVKELLAVFLRRLLPSFSSKMPPPSRREAYMGNPFTGN